MNSSDFEKLSGSEKAKILRQAAATHEGDLKTLLGWITEQGGWNSEMRRHGLSLARAYIEERRILEILHEAQPLIFNEDSLEALWMWAIDRGLQARVAENIMAALGKPATLACAPFDWFMVHFSRLPTSHLVKLGVDTKASEFPLPEYFKRMLNPENLDSEEKRALIAELEPFGSLGGLATVTFTQGPTATDRDLVDDWCKYRAMSASLAQMWSMRVMDGEIEEMQALERLIRTWVPEICEDVAFRRELENRASSFTPRSEAEAIEIVRSFDRLSGGRGPRPLVRRMLGPLFPCGPAYPHAILAEVLKKSPEELAAHTLKPL